MGDADLHALCSWNGERTMTWDAMLGQAVPCPQNCCATERRPTPAPRLTVVEGGKGG